MNFFWGSKKNDTRDIMTTRCRPISLSILAVLFTSVFLVAPAHVHAQISSAVVGTCSGDASESCCIAHAVSTGCVDAACCAEVCSNDSFCCDTQWDQLCADFATTVCGVCTQFCGDGSCDPGEACDTCVADCGDCPTCPGAGDCCSLNGSAGCSDETCCDTVCAADATCCDSTWDQLCADQAAVLCSICLPTCGDKICDSGETCDSCPLDCGACPTCPGVGDCCLPNGSAACDDAVCCETVCGADPLCCDTSWDQPCADQAAALCSICAAFCGDGSCDPDETCDGCPGDCGVCPACPGTGHCCEANGTAGCDDESCCDSVCAVDPFCCDTTWDANCTQQAVLLCPSLGCGGACCTADASLAGAAGFSVPVDPLTGGVSWTNVLKLSVAFLSGDAGSRQGRRATVQGDDATAVERPSPASLTTLRTVSSDSGASGGGALVCNLTTEAFCLSVGGDYKGSDTSCSDNNICPAAICGNGIQDFGEACDDGFADACGTCNADCSGPGSGTGSACDDGDACTTGDVCLSDAAGSCAGSDTSAADCDDLVPCTLDTCSPGAGCANTPVNSACDDGNVCTTDTCDAISGCDSDGTGVTVNCDDANACTTGDVCLGDAAGNCAGILGLAAYQSFFGCLNGPSGGALAPACDCFDIDVDGDVDMFDFASFQRDFADTP